MIGGYGFALKMIFLGVLLTFAGVGMLISMGKSLGEMIGLAWVLTFVGPAVVVFGYLMWPESGPEDRMDE